MSKSSIVGLLTNDDTNPLTLDRILNDLAPTWLVWEPETTWEFLRSYTRKIPTLTAKTKINTMRLLHNSEGPWVDWDVFCRACDGLTSFVPDFDLLRKPDLGDVFITVGTMSKLRSTPFSDEVKKFIAGVCLNDGILFAPKPIDFVQDILNIVEYKCSLCGNVDIYDNGKCDTCGAPESALILVPKYFDWREVESKWNEIQNKPLETITLEENLIDIHLYKLLDAYSQLVEYLQQHNEEMKNAA